MDPFLRVLTERYFFCIYTRSASQGRLAFFAFVRFFLRVLPMYCCTPFDEKKAVFLCCTSHLSMCLPSQRAFICATAVPLNGAQHQEQAHVT